MSEKNTIARTHFLKMHGCGNDFVILEARDRAPALSPGVIRGMADRRTGIGCDQLLVIEPSKKADAFMRIYNADGSDAAQCGNGIRCIAAIVMDEKNTGRVKIETVSGVLDCHRVPAGIAINMGKPSFAWRDVPLSEERDTLHLGLDMGALKDPCALSVGNPHVVYFVDDADAIDLARLGPRIETYFLFPDRVNVSAAQVLSDNEIRLRVWERGTGITRACGTAACATLAAAHKRGLTGRKAAINMDGGTLHVEWLEADDLILAGAIEKSFEGTADLPLSRKKENVA